MKPIETPGRLDGRASGLLLEMLPGSAHFFGALLGQENRLHFLLVVQYSVMGNRVFGVSDLADTLSYLYFGLDHFDRKPYYVTLTSN